MTYTELETLEKFAVRSPKQIQHILYSHSKSFFWGVSLLDGGSISGLTVWIDELQDQNSITETVGPFNVDEAHRFFLFLNLQSDDQTDVDSSDIT